MKKSSEDDVADIRAATVDVSKGLYLIKQLKVLFGLLLRHKIDICADKVLQSNFFSKYI